MICLYLVIRARETLIYHLRIDTNLLATAARRWEKAKKAEVYVWSLSPATRVTWSSYQLPDTKNRWREGRREGTDASLFTFYGGSRYQNLPTPSSLPGAAVHFACLLTLLALLCFWLLELCS